MMRDAIPTPAQVPASASAASKTRRAGGPTKRKAGLRRRDLLVLTGCLVGMLLSFQSDGEASFKDGFVVPWSEGEMQVETIHRLPKPLVTDVDGDGANDIVAATGSDIVRVLTNYRPTRAASGYVQELTSKYETRTSSLVVGLGAGHLTKSAKPVIPVVLKKKPAEETHKKHIVVVTDDYIVTCYSNEMTEVWAVRLPVPEARQNYMYDEIEEAEDLYGWFTPEYATVLVLPNEIYTGDKGIVVVGIEVEVPQDLEEDEDANIGATPSKQLSYFALSGSDGALRWSHNSTDEVKPSQASGLRAQHSYKLTVQHLEKHTSDQDWRYYRNNLVASLPHVYTHPHDAHLQLHRFAPKKNRKKKEKDHSAHKEEKAQSYKTADRSRTQNDYGHLGGKVWSLLQWRKRRALMPAPNVILAHRKNGIEALHLYTGTSITQVGPFEQGVLYEDVNDDTVIDAVHTVLGDQQNLDTYSRSWSGQKSLCSGIVTAGAPVARTALFNHSICKEGGMLNNFDFLKTLMKQDDEDEGTATNSLGGIEIPGFGGRDHFDDTVSAAAPISIHRYGLWTCQTTRAGVCVLSRKCPTFFLHTLVSLFPLPRNRHVHMVGSLTVWRTDILFYISSGLVTCINGKTGKLRWHANTDALFGAHAAGGWFAHHMGAQVGDKETALDAEHR